MSKKIYYEEVYECFKSRGFKLLDSEYINSASKMDCVDIEGYKLSVSYNSLKIGTVPSRIGNGNKNTIENIRHYLNINRNDISLIDTEFKNVDSRLKFKCLTHDKTFYVSWSNLKSCRGCSICSQNYGNKGFHRLSIDIIKERIVKMGRNNSVELISNTYVNNREKLIFKCLIHNKNFTQRWTDFQSGCGCQLCGIERTTGENHPNYNKDKTDEERLIKRHYQEYYVFTKAVYRRDGRKCQLCNCSSEVNLNVHHLDGYNWCKDKRTDPNNGIVLCEYCHKEFHNIYGNRNNTKEQYIEFRQNKLNSNKGA